MECEPLPWNGVLDPAQLVTPVVTEAHRLADAAKSGDWVAVVRILDDGANISWWRPGGTTWFTVLHQAAWHGASANVAEGLVARGALRAQTDSRGRTAYDVCLDKHDVVGSPAIDALCEVLLPPSSTLPPHRIRAMDHHLGEVIDRRIREFSLYEARIPREVLRYPSVGIMHELPRQRLWFPVPGMYGGFLLTLRGEELHSESWSRVVGESGQHHVVDHNGVRLVDEGFV